METKESEKMNLTQTLRRKRLKENGTCLYCGSKREKSRQQYTNCITCADKLKVLGKLKTLEKRARLGKGPLPSFIDYRLNKPGSQCPRCKYKVRNICTIYGYDTHNVKYPCNHKEKTK